MTRVEYWNHNAHYQPVIIGAVPAVCGTALEVGYGDGLLASRLAERCAEVIAERTGNPERRTTTM